MNATHLFGRPFVKFHNSESWWTAFFALAVLHEARLPAPRPLRVCSHGHDNRFSWIGHVEIEGLTLDNLIVEGPLSEYPFALPVWPTVYFGLKPDVAFLNQATRSVTFIEVKTIGASVAGNVLVYADLAEHLRSQGWTTHVYYLSSHGHERDWKLISERRLQLILWEDVLAQAATTPLAQSLGIDLDPYVTLPPELQEPTT